MPRRRRCSWRWPLPPARLAWLQDMRLAYAGLRMAFSDSLPRAAIEKIARRPDLLKMEGETRTVTYLVCGVRGLSGWRRLIKTMPAASPA